MKPVRSLLFVPGHRGSWVEKAVRAGADAVILDLEDAVPANLKAQAREEVARSVAWLHQHHPRVSVYVRVNPLESHLTGDDVEAVVRPGLTGLVLPKSYGTREVLHLEALVDHYERRGGVEAGALEFILSLETAESYANCEALAVASPRVASLFAGTARDGDLARSLGFRFTTEGLETLYLRSRAVLACRAAGLNHPIVGLWQDIADLDGARLFAEQNRQLGFKGQVLIHPSHVAIANQVFSPAPAEVEFYTGMIAAFQEAEAQGASAINFEGMHIDYAHVQTAREVLEYARLFTPSQQAGEAPSGSVED